MPQKVSHLRENQNQHWCPRISSFLNKLILVILTFLHSDRYYYGCKEIAVKICRLTVAIGKNHVEITAFNNISKSGIKESCHVHCTCIHKGSQCHETHPLNGPLSRTTRVSPYQKGKTNLDFTEARASEWQWHQLGHVQVCTLLQTDNHASTPPLGFL